MSTRLVDAYHAYLKIRSIQASKSIDNRINVLYRSMEELKSKKDTWSEEECEFQVMRQYLWRANMSNISFNLNRFFLHDCNETLFE